MPLGSPDGEGTVERQIQQRENNEGVWCPKELKSAHASRLPQPVSNHTSHLPQPVSQLALNDNSQALPKSENQDKDEKPQILPSLSCKQEPKNECPINQHEQLLHHEGTNPASASDGVTPLSLRASPRPSSSEQNQEPLKIEASRSQHSPSSSEDEYFKPLKRLRMVELEQNQNVDGKLPLGPGVKSFSITDILSHDPIVQAPPEPCLKIVRPWDLHGDEMSISSCESSAGSPRPSSSGTESRTGTESDGERRSRGRDGNPLDALFQMTSKTFDRSKSQSGMV